MDTSLNIYDRADQLLAALPLPEGALEEGTHGEVRAFDWAAEVLRDGRAARYRAFDAKGRVVTKGRVIRSTKPGDTRDGLLRLARVELKRGERLTGHSTALTAEG